MSEERRTSNFGGDVRSIDQNWVHILIKGKLRGRKWKKRWMVIRSNGTLKSYKERPMSLTVKLQHNTFEIGPESTVRWDNNLKAIILTSGEKSTDCVFRLTSSSTDSLQDMEDEKDNGKWVDTIKQIALRKRMWYVLQIRSGCQKEQKTSFPTIVSPPPLYIQKVVSEDLWRSIEETFDKDCQEFWWSGLQSSGHNIYYDFNDSDIEIIWHMYAKQKPYICTDCLELLLDDAFMGAYSNGGTNITENSHNFKETIYDRAYSAMVFLDSKNKDGFVDFEDFKLINTRAFWRNVNFLKPILPNQETEILWVSVFDYLEDEGTLSKNLIHKLWMRYSSKDDGYLYQDDIADFLADFMEATLLKWPDTDEDLVDEFHKKISTRAAIAVRFLNGDESAKVTLEQFAAIGQEDFWMYVDFFPTGNNEDDDNESETYTTAEATMTLVSEPSVISIIRSLSGADEELEADFLSSPIDEPENRFVYIQNVEEKSPILEEAEEKLEITLTRSSTLRNRESFMIPEILEAIEEQSMGDSDFTDSMPDSTSDGLPHESNREGKVCFSLSRTVVTDRRHSLRLMNIISEPSTVSRTLSI